MMLFLISGKPIAGAAPIATARHLYKMDIESRRQGGVSSAVSRGFQRPALPPLPRISVAAGGTEGVLQNR